MDGDNAAEAVEAAKPAENGEMEASFQVGVIGSEVTNGEAGGEGTSAQPAPFPASSEAGGATSTLRSLSPRAHFERYKALYDSGGLDCDLTLTCADSQSVRCHAAVVAAAFPVLGQLLLGDEDGPFLDEHCVFLADFERDEVRRVVDWVYAVLVSGGGGGGDDDNPDADGEGGQQDLYIDAELATALCAGQELTTEAEAAGKKRRGRKSKWVCETCGQKKPKKIPATRSKSKAAENNNENGGSFVLPARVKVEADPDFAVNDYDEQCYEPAAFEPAIGWGGEVDDDIDDDDWGYGEKKPKAAGRKRGRPKKEPGAGRPRGRPKRVKKEWPESDDEYAPGMDIDRHNKVSDGDDDNDDDEDEWDVDRKGFAGGSDKTGCILATLPEDNVKTTHEVAEYDTDFPESSIASLQYMLSNTSGTFTHVNPAGPVLGFTKATTLMSTSYFQALVGVKAAGGSNPESLRALPLTWSSPRAAEIVHQRDMFVAAVKKVYGYSETDLFHNRATTEGRNLPGKSYRDIKQNWELKRKRMTQAMVNAHLSEMEQLLKEMKRRPDGLESPLEMGENPYAMALDPTLTCDEVENVFMVMWHRYLDPLTGRRKVEATCTPLLRATIGIAHVKSNSTRMNFDKTSRRAYRVMRLAYNIWLFRGPFALPGELHERTSAIAATYFELEQGGDSIELRNRPKYRLKLIKKDTCVNCSKSSVWGVR